MKGLHIVLEVCVCVCVCACVCICRERDMRQRQKETFREDDEIKDFLLKKKPMIVFFSAACLISLHILKVSEEQIKLRGVLFISSTDSVSTTLNMFSLIAFPPRVTTSRPPPPLITAQTNK